MLTTNKKQQQSVLSQHHKL